MKRGYDLLLDWIETARIFGDVEEPWYAVEIVHSLELRRYEILRAEDEFTIASLYFEIFLDDPMGESLELCEEIRELYLRSPTLLMNERADAVLEGLLARDLVGRLCSAVLDKAFSGLPTRGLLGTLGRGLRGLRTAVRKGGGAGQALAGAPVRRLGPVVDRDHPVAVLFIKFFQRLRHRRLHG